MTSNAPYSDQRKFNANNNLNNIVGVSNSPFTDQRKQTGGGGGGDGNVFYDGINLSSDNQVITNVDNEQEALSYGNSSGVLEMNTITDEVKLTSTTGDIKIESNKDIEMTVKNECRMISSATEIGNMFSWKNEVAGDKLGEFRYARGSSGREIIICDSIDTFSFAGNLTSSQQRPSIKFSQIDTDDCFVAFINRPENDGDVLTFNGEGEGSSENPREVEWLSNTVGNVIYNPEDNSLRFDDGNGEFFINLINQQNTDTTIKSGDAVIVLGGVDGSIDIASGLGQNKMLLRQGDQNQISLGDTNENDSVIFLESKGDDSSQLKNTVAMQAANGSSDTVTVQCIASETSDSYFRIAVTNAPLGGSSSTSIYKQEGDGVAFISTERFTIANEANTSNSSPLFSFGNKNNGQPEYFKWAFNPSINNVLSVVSGTGIESEPYLLGWTQALSGGDGNVTSDFLTDRLTRDNGAGTQVLIETIDQGDNPFTIKNYGENEINMTRDREFGQPNERATIELKSFGDAFENRILLNTFTTASTGTSMLMTSSDDVSQPNSIRFTTSNIIQDSITPYFQADGSPNGTAARRRFSLSDKEAYFGSFRVLNFSGVNTGQAGFNPSYKWNGANYYRWDNTPAPSQGVLNSVLTVTSGNGLEGSPFSMNWMNSPTGNDLDTLDITYDQTTSVLVLSDPVDGVISTTTVVPGRTVLISDVIIADDIPLFEYSVLGLSNSIFPPVAVAHLIGNNPPRVSLNATTGLTNWFVGASFKISIAGDLMIVPLNDVLTLKVWSNRGQATSNLLNSFEVKTVLINSLSFGWSWDVNFTCRSVNDGNILGVITTASKFQYSDDDIPQVSRIFGRQVSNTSSSFDTSVDQYLDCTIESDAVGTIQTRIKTTTCTIERIY